MKKTANVLVGITGSISILNLPACLGLLKYHFDNVKVIMTDSADKLLPSSTISLFCDEVYVNEEMEPSKKMGHVELVKWADIFIVVPATANKIGEAAQGLGRDFLSSAILAYPNPVLFFPNMNQLMWNNSIVQRNIKFLETEGHIIVPPHKKDAYEVASGTIRTNFIIPNISEIVTKVMEELNTRSSPSSVSQ